MAKGYGSSAVAERGGAMTRGQGWRTIRQRTAAFRSMARARRKAGRVTANRGAAARFLKKLAAGGVR